MRKLSLALCSTVLCCSASIAGNQTQPIEAVASFNAMSELTKIVGGDKVKVSTFIPNGMEPHDFEPKISDFEKLQHADLLIINGLGMEPWAYKIAKNLPRLKIVTASEKVKPIELDDKHPDSERDHGAFDPHTWLSPSNAVLEAYNIANALCEYDKRQCPYFKNNYQAFADKMEQLQQEYRKKFEQLQKRNIVTGHAAFAYLARDFQLNQKSVENVFAEGEPSPKQLAALADFCKNNDVKVVFAEEMVSPKISKALALESGAQVKTIYTMESAEDRMSFYERMKANLSKIYSSLQ